MLPDNITYLNKGAAIKISDDGHTLYASNRGHDSVAIFRILDNGLLEPLEIDNVSGKTPRDIALFDDVLVSANQDSGKLSVHSIKPNGTLGELLSITEVIKPVCICKVN